MGLRRQCDRLVALAVDASLRGSRHGDRVESKLFGVWWAEAKLVEALQEPFARRGSR